MDVMGKLVELLAEFYGCDPMYYGVDALAIAQHLIANGVAPVKHGRWVNKRKEDCFDGEEPVEVGMENGEPLASSYCSECGEWLVASDEYSMKGRYCPNCGAKIESEE